MLFTTEGTVAGEGGEAEDGSESKLLKQIFIFQRSHQFFIFQRLSPIFHFSANSPVFHFPTISPMLFGGVLGYLSF